MEEKGEHCEPSEPVDLALECALNAQARDLLLSNAQLVWNSIYEDGPLKDVPLIGTIVKSVVSLRRIQKAMYAKKLLNFLIEMSRLSESERIQLTNTLSNDNDEIRQTGETLFVVLDQLESAEKASVLGRLFREYLVSNITRDDFLRISLKLLRCSFPDLVALKAFAYGSLPEPLVCADLANAGLMRLKTAEDEAIFWSPGNDSEDFEVNDHGEILIRVISDLDTLVRT